VKDHSSRLEQVEHRILELKNKVEIKEKDEEMLVKQLMIYGRNLQEHRNSIKRANLRIMGTEEEEVQAKGIHNLFTKILPIQVQETSRTTNRLDQNRTCPQHIIIKTTSTEKTEKY
jgi:hypothetical protein